jgi:hypothetical protein
VTLVFTVDLSRKRLRLRDLRPVLCVPGTLLPHAVAMRSSVTSAFQIGDRRAPRRVSIGMATPAWPDERNLAGRGRTRYPTIKL